DRLEGREVELLFAVVAVIRRGKLSRLEPIGTHDHAVAHVLDDEVIARIVETVLIEAIQVGAIESLVELEIEDIEAQALSGEKVGIGRCEAQLIVAGEKLRRPRSGGRRFHLVRKTDALTLP